MYCRCGCKAITPVAKRNRKELGHRKGEHIDYLLGHKMRGVTGQRHHNFKGNSVGYKAFHLRVNIARGKAKICEDCGSALWVEWASVTKNYGDIYDYKSLCRVCHNIYDNKANRVAEIKRKKYNLSDIARKGWETRRLLSKGGGVTA